MPVAVRRIVPLVLLAALAVSLPACWGGKGDTGDNLLGINLDEGIVTFWARDLSGASGAFYEVPSVLIAEGTRCRVYREIGQNVTDNTARNIALAFDNVIYPRATAAFGLEPRPVSAGGTGDVDQDAKVTILLMDIRDGYATTGFFVGGMFDPVNEFRQSALDAVGGGARSNEREMICLDVNPMRPGDTVALRELARQFQHMIHFNASARNKRGPGGEVLLDEAWLDEAMSEVAPAYCRYELEYERLYYFELYPWDSLTEWTGNFLDFSPAFMWGTYFRDRFDNNVTADNGVFRLMLASDNAGIASVNDALARRGTGTDFAGAFLDWSIAVAVGNRALFKTHPEWTYYSIGTAGGSLAGFIMPGLFNPGNYDNAALRTLGPWSLDYYSYAPSEGSDNTLTWTPVDNALAASMFSFNGATYTHPSDVLPGVKSPYVGTAYLIVRNPTDNGGLGGGNVSFAPVGAPGAPREMPRASARTAAPGPAVPAAPLHAPLCAEPFLVGETRALLARGAVLPF